MSSSIKFIQLGFGPIGQKIFKYATERNILHPVAVIDIDKEKIGKDAGVIAGTGNTGIAVSNDLEVALNSSADIVIVATSSKIEVIEEQISASMQHSKNVISTSEELLYPWKNNEIIAKRLDRLAKEHNVSILGTGINPGLLMDTLPLVLSAAARRVDSIEIKRHQNASERRLPFQKKIGAGLSIEEFSHLRDKKFIRHVGFSESIRMIAAGLGIKLDNIIEKVEPVIAEEPVKSDFINVQKGYVKGVHQTAHGFVENKPVISLELLAYLGNSNSKDEIIIYGNPNITSTISGGVNGDMATAAVIVNAIPRVIDAKAGLRTMLDIGIPSCYR